MKSTRDSGQIALVLILIMVVVGTATVTLAGRAVVETRVQEMNADSSQAMLAAESGLEQALKIDPTGTYTGTIDSNTSFTVTDQSISGSGTIVGPLKNGEVWEINLVGATGGVVNLYWESYPGTGGSPRGLYVAVVNPTGLIDYPIGPVGFGSGFSATGINTNQTLSGRVFDYEIPILYSVGSSRVIRVMALGGDTYLGFSAGAGTLPEQIRQKVAVGTVSRGAESIKQGIGYTESMTDQIPPVFFYSLYSGGAIVQ